MAAKSLKFTVTGNSESPTDNRPGFSAIALTAEVDSDASADEIAEILRIAETRCPVNDNLNNRTPMTLRCAPVPQPVLA